MEIAAMRATIREELDDFDLVPGAGQRRVDRLEFTAGLGFGRQGGTRNAEGSDDGGAEQGKQSFHEVLRGKKLGAEF
jgi:hypothetical protein